MRLFACFIFFLSLFLSARAQQYHFIYIQTENRQPFYVKLNDRIFSSSTSGYVIIPKLVDSTYKFTIGFPKNEWPSQNAEIIINAKDEGFLFKNFGEKGWGLFNLQSLNIIMTIGNASLNPAPVEDRSDAFSTALAEATNTASVRQVEFIANENTQADPAELKPVTHIKQTFSDIDITGRSLIYTLTTDNITDSITLFIPYDNKEAEEAYRKMQAAQNAINTVADSTIKPTDTIAVAEKQVMQTDSLALKNEEAVKPVITDIKITDPADDAKADFKLTIINPVCKSTATDDDFLRLRKKMTKAESDEDMIEAAKKGFRSKCFTAEQVKNLSRLFQKDEGKYNFFDAAYTHVTDIGNFKDLQSQLTDEYYITRFRAILR